MAGKNDIAEHLANTFEGVTKKHATEAVDAVFDYIAHTLGGGGKVQVPGFGTFEVRHRKARAGRNPQTGAKINIAASNGVGFKAGKALKDKVN